MAFEPLCSVVRSVAHYVPERIVTNEDMSAFMETSDSWIAERTGIRQRRFAAPDEPSSALGIKAAHLALERAELRVTDIDLIVAATLSPDFYFPGVGTLIQSKMGMPTIPALDIRAQCSGLVYGLSTVDAFIRSGQAKRVLLVCTEVQSSILDLTTRGREMAVLFGDGAGALVIEAAPCKNTATGKLTVASGQRGIIDSLLGSDGSGAELLCLKAPGTATSKFIKPSDLEEGAQYPKMEGRTVFKHAITRMTETVVALLDRHGLKPADLDLLIPHQANARISEMVREKLELPEDKVFNNIARYGNTTAATIPICLSEAEAQGKLKKGQLIVTVAFGAGFTWGANLVRW